jgi:hypothetical protein
MYIGFWALNLVCMQYGFCGLGSPQECENNLYFILFYLSRAKVGNVFQLGLEQGFFGAPQGLPVVGLGLILS